MKHGMIDKTTAIFYKQEKNTNIGILKFITT